MTSRKSEIVNEAVIQSKTELKSFNNIYDEYLLCWVKMLLFIWALVFDVWRKVRWVKFIFSVGYRLPGGRLQ